MILIFGGVYQGKLNYALKRFNLTEKDVFRCENDNPSVPEGKIIYELDKWILALLKSGEDVKESLKKLDRDSIVICNDISCGIVPVDPLLRKWREDVGRSLALLSRNSEEVIRMFCGFDSRIK